MLTELGLIMNMAPLQSGRDCLLIILPVKFCKQTLSCRIGNADYGEKVV